MFIVSFPPFFCTRLLQALDMFIVPAVRIRSAWKIQSEPQSPLRRSAAARFLNTQPSVPAGANGTRLQMHPFCNTVYPCYVPVSRWLGAAAYAAGLVAVCMGLHSAWGLRSLGGERGAWALTAGVVAVFLGVIAQGLGAPPPAGQKKPN